MLDSSSKKSLQSISQGPLQPGSRKTGGIPERESQKNLLSAPPETSARCCLCSTFTSRLSQVVSHLLSFFVTLAPAGELSSCRKSAMKRVKLNMLNPMGRSLLFPASFGSCRSISLPYSQKTREVQKIRVKKGYALHRWCCPKKIHAVQRINEVTLSVLNLL